MQATAQGWLVLTLTDSPGALGLTSAAATLPVLFLSIFAGVLADRIDRRRLLVATQLTVAALAAVLAVLTMTGVATFWHVVALAAMAGSAQALATPAFQAVVSTIVRREALGNAIALNAAQFNLSRILGPAVAGAAIAAGGLAFAFWANAIGLAIVALVLATLPLSRERDMMSVEASLWANLLDGLRHVRANRTIAVLLLLAGVPALFVLNYLFLLPVFARDILDIGAPGLGLLTGSIGFGALVGALGVAVLRPGGGSGRLLIVGLAVASIAIVTFALSESLVVSVVALVALGTCQVAYYATTNTLLQMLVPARLRGRILSLYILTSWGGIPIGNLVAGAVAERFGAPFALAAGGLITLLVLAVVVIAYPPLRHLRADSIAAGTA